MAPKELHIYLKIKIILYKQKSPAIPRSESMHLLAHLSNHLLPDNESSDHRHTHSERVSYAQYINKIHEINMPPIPN